MSQSLDNKEAYYKLLSGPLSRKAIDIVINAAGDNEEIISYISKLVINGPEPIPMRASWALEGIDLKFPHRVNPFIKSLIKSIRTCKHSGTRRNILKLLTRKTIPEDQQGHLINYCFEWLVDKAEPVAVKVYAMQIIMNHSKEYPELKQELKEILEEQYELSSPGFKSKANHIFRSINKM
jgi:hypothetical protein